MRWLLFKWVLHPLADPRGTQGRLLLWHPGACESKRKALPAYCPDLLARFCKESSLSKQEMLPDVGKRFCCIPLPTAQRKKKRVEITWTSEHGRRTWPYAASQSCCRSLLLLFAPVGGWFRRGPMAVRHKGFRNGLQLCVVPAYALTIHKVSVCSHVLWKE